MKKQFEQHKLDRAEFIRKWKLWLWFAMIPSFGLDLLAICAYGYDWVNKNMDLQHLLISAASFVGINAIIVKGFIIYYFYRFKDMRERSYILINDNELRYICYSMRVGSDATDAVSAYYYKEYMIKKVESLTIRKDGALICGLIEVTKHRMDIEYEKDISSTPKVQKTLKIPAYYYNWARIIEHLKSYQ